MAFSIRVLTDAGDKCAICRKPPTDKALAFDMWTVGRWWNDKNYIAVHERCLLRAMAKAKAEYAELVKLVQTEVVPPDTVPDTKTEEN